MATTKPVSSILTSITRKNPRSSLSPYICTPCLRSHQQSQYRPLHHSVKPSPVPSPTPFVPDVQTFLTLIGRNLSQHASKFESWSSLFTMTSPQLKELGIEPARSRKYLLRWRHKFRNGEYGVGGDFKYVSDGVGELRIVEVPAIQKRSAAKEGALQESTQSVSTSTMPGMTKLILNLPRGETTYHAALNDGQGSHMLKKPKDYNLKGGNLIVGPYAEALKGSKGSAVLVKVQEGMWEDRRGQKVFGGERRRAEVLHKMAVAEHRKNN